MSFILKEQFAEGCFIEHHVSQMLESVSSEYQDIMVVDLVHFGKALIIDGAIQSTARDEHIYHESLVHPALLMANNPKSVFIGGGGELATAREVLKHFSVESITMVDIDSDVIRLARKHLPEWGGDSVHNDPRLRIVYQDAVAFLQNYSGEFDIIIMDITDKFTTSGGYQAIESTISLYSADFYKLVYSKLSMNGIFITQAGTGESFSSIYRDISLSFSSLLPYSVFIPSFFSEWGFIIAEKGSLLKSYKKAMVNVIDELIRLGISGNLKFYNNQIHLKMFSNP